LLAVSPEEIAILEIMHVTSPEADGIKTFTVNLPGLADWIMYERESAHQQRESRVRLYDRARWN
jgi:hypothetical protein